MMYDLKELLKKRIQKYSMCLIFRCGTNIDELLLLLYKNHKLEMSRYSTFWRREFLIARLFLFLALNDLKV